MRELLFFVTSSFWAGAAHAATPGHGKTIAAAYIVGARGKPIDAVILGIFVTLSHVSGIVLVGVLASLGSTWLRPQRIEAYLAVAVGILVITLGLWMLWAQRDLLAAVMGAKRTSCLGRRCRTNESATPGGYLDETSFDEASHRLTDQGAADAKVLRQVAFGWQLRTGC